MYQTHQCASAYAALIIAFISLAPCCADDVMDINAAFKNIASPDAKIRQQAYDTIKNAGASTTTRLNSILTSGTESVLSKIQAATLLAELKSTDSIAPLSPLITKENHVMLRIVAAYSLVQLGRGDLGLPVLVEILKQGGAPGRTAAQRLMILGEKASKVQKDLEEATESADKITVVFAASALCKLGKNESAIQKLSQLFKSNDKEVSASAGAGLAFVGGAGTTVLVEAMSDPNESTALHAIALAPRASDISTPAVREEIVRGLMVRLTPKEMANGRSRLALQASIALSQMGMNDDEVREVGSYLSERWLKSRNDSERTSMFSCLENLPQCLKYAPIVELSMKDDGGFGLLTACLVYRINRSSAAEAIIIAQLKKGSAPAQEASCMTVIEYLTRMGKDAKSLVPQIKEIADNADCPANLRSAARTALSRINPDRVPSKP